MKIDPMRFLVIAPAEKRKARLPRRFRCSGLVALRSGSACHRIRGLLWSAVQQSLLALR